MQKKVHHPRKPEYMSVKLMYTITLVREEVVGSSENADSEETDTTSFWERVEGGVED